MEAMARVPKNEYFKNYFTYSISILFNVILKCHLELKSFTHKTRKILIFKEAGFLLSVGFSKYIELGFDRLFLNGLKRQDNKFLSSSNTSDLATSNFSSSAVTSITSTLKLVSA